MDVVPIDRVVGHAVRRVGGRRKGSLPVKFGAAGEFMRVVGDERRRIRRRSAGTAAYECDERGAALHADQGGGVAVAAVATAVDVKTAAEIGAASFPVQEAKAAVATPLDTPL